MCRVFTWAHQIHKYFFAIVYFGGRNSGMDVYSRYAIFSGGYLDITPWFFDSVVNDMR